MSINAVYEDSQGNVHESRMDGVDLTTKISIADDFSALVNYAVGDFCYHLGTLYKCTTVHTAGAWNAAHFTATQVGDEIGELKNTLTLSTDTVEVSFPSDATYIDSTISVAKQGKSAIGVVGVACGNYDMIPYSFKINNQNLYYGIRSRTGSALGISSRCIVTILYRNS